MLPPEISLPQSAEIFDSEHPESLSSTEIREKLRDDWLRDIISNRCIIIINDHHRSTPSGVILDILAELYSEIANVDYIVIAGGTHEEPSDKQLSQLTHKVEEQFNCDILIHDPLEEETDLVYLGTTSRGTEVKLHPVLLDYDNIICINSVEPHYFAGFTGGVKSIIPGLAAKTTVEKNHAWALSPKSGPTLTDENPLQIDLWEAASFLEKQFFGIQMVNFQDEIYHIASGELKAAFNDAKIVSKSIYSRTVSHLYDVIVSIVYPPLDRSLYQAQKGIENTRQALKPGGEMILVAICSEGIGNQAFFDTLSHYDKVEDVLNNITIESYSFGDHKAYKFASLAKESKITLIGELTLSQAKRVFASQRPISDLEPYLAKLAREGKSMAIVLDSGALTLSYGSK